MFKAINSNWFILIGALLLALVATLFFLWRPGSGMSSVDEGPNPRSDVVDWIEQHYGNDPKKKIALTRLAEAYQYLLIHADSDYTTEVDRRTSIAMACYNVAFPDSYEEETVDGLPTYEALAAQSINTFNRTRKWIAYHGTLNGRVLDLANISSWEKQCETPFSP